FQFQLPMLHSSFAHMFVGVLLDFFGPTYFGKILGASVLILQTNCFNVGQLLFWFIRVQNR
ncbi:hypothetical protein SO802_008737, partial [Lithocarpus litseifolius]